MLFFWSILIFSKDSKYINIFINSGWSKNQVNLKFSSIALTNVQFEEYLKWFSKHKVASEIYQKTKLFEKAWMVKIMAGLICLVKCVRTFSNQWFSKVCYFVDGFAMRPDNGLNCIKWFLLLFNDSLLVFIHLRMKLRA